MNLELGTFIIASSLTAMACSDRSVAVHDTSGSQGGSGTGAGPTATTGSGGSTAQTPNPDQDGTGADETGEDSPRVDLASPSPVEVSCGAETCLPAQSCVGCPGESPDAWTTTCVDRDEFGNPIGADCAGAVVASCDGPEDCGPEQQCQLVYAANSVVVGCEPAGARGEDCQSFAPSVCHTDEDCSCGRCEADATLHPSVCRER
ncbi:MAG: hypothetical protein JKY37_07535 [Nannocystaceae bacterium]|nr:hypothetical protein [Nannocystaceae bacterium]